MHFHIARGSRATKDTQLTPATKDAPPEKEGLGLLGVLDAIYMQASEKMKLGLWIVTGPAYRQDLIQPYHQGRDLRSASHDLFNVPFTKSTVIRSRAFGVAGPTL